MRKLFLPLVLALVLLGGCGGPEAPASELKDTAKTTKTNTQTAIQAIADINGAVAAFPSTFKTAYAKDQAADFETTGAVSALTTKREAAASRFKTAQKTLNEATTTLTKRSRQVESPAVQAALKDVLAALRLVQLDGKTFNAYYKEMTTAEADFFDEVAQDPTNTAGIDGALSRLTQYGSVLGQQGDVATANLKSVTTATKQLQEALAALKP